MAARLTNQLPQVEKEGFLCPVCVKDLRSAELLAKHFDTAHSTTNTGDDDVIDQVKGFFGKAKKFFQFEEDTNPEHSQTSLSVNEQNCGNRTTSLRLSSSLPTEILESGTTRSLTEYFRKNRDANVDRVVIETNKLIIRLSKLTGNDVPEEGPKRKAFEQKTVPWVDDSSSKTCMTCGKGFGLRRRRHHCRLCGGLMCDQCSEFLPFSHATLFSSSMLSTEVSASQPAFLSRRGSNSSLNSIGTQETGPTLRTCLNCKKRLESHRVKHEQRYGKTKIAALYENLREAQDLSEKIIVEYNKMARSLMSGETTYSLESATMLRQKIGNYYASMDVCSKQILNLGVPEDEVSSTAMRVQANIRAFIVSYIQEHKATLPSLPEEKQLHELILQRDQQRKKKVQRELQEAEALRKTLEQKDLHHKKTSIQRLQPNQQVKESRDSVTADGWKPGEVDAKLTADDSPMVQQINIIKGYIKQAKQAERWDEVEMLKDNLHQLEEEFYQDN